MDLAETFRKWSSHGFEKIMVYFKCFDKILLVSAHHIIIEWSIFYNLISCSKMMGFGSNL